MTNLITLGSREILGKTVAAYGTVENPIFLATTVAEGIEHSDVSAMLKNVDDDEKIKIKLPSDYCSGGLQPNTEYWFLTEDGLYEVLFLSRKPIAKAFKAEVKKLLRDVRLGAGLFSHLEQENVILRQKLQVFEEHHPAKFYDYDEAAALCSHYRKPPFGREHLKRWLVTKGILCKQAAKNDKPIQHYLYIRWFIPVIHEWYRRGRKYSENRFYISPKGLMGMIEMMIRDNLLHIPATPQQVFPELYPPTEASQRLSIADEPSADVETA